MQVFEYTTPIGPPEDTWENKYPQPVIAETYGTFIPVLFNSWEEALQESFERRF